MVDHLKGVLMKRAVFALVAALAAFFVPAVASAGVDPYATAPQINVDDTTPTPNQPFTVTLSGFAANETVRVVISPSDTVVNVTVDAAGAGSVQLTAPSTSGTYTITSTGLTSNRTDSVQITVITSGGGGGGLPATGSDSNRLLRLGGVAAAFGAVLLGVSMVRRRQRHSVSV
jgi:LPXTG-motif cell wall-anchored protein